MQTLLLRAGLTFTRPPYGIAADATLCRPTWIEPTGLSPAGFDMASLQREMMNESTA